MIVGVGVRKSQINCKQEAVSRKAHRNSITAQQSETAIIISRKHREKFSAWTPSQPMKRTYHRLKATPAKRTVSR